MHCPTFLVLLVITQFLSENSGKYPVNSNCPIENSSTIKGKSLKSIYIPTEKYSVYYSSIWLSGFNSLAKAITYKTLLLLTACIYDLSKL